MPPTDLQKALLDLVDSKGYRPLKPKAIAKRLGLNQESTRDLKRIIKRLIKKGQLRWGPEHLVQRTRDDSSAASESTPEKSKTKSKGSPSDAITGVFRRMAGGFGFVTPSRAARSPAQKQDIYISAKNSSDASSGDTVLVRLLARKGRRPDKVEGQIIDIVEREKNRFVGTYFERAGNALVTVAGKLFSQPISVGDPGAKSVREGDIVVIEMVRFPSHAHDGEGVIVDVLGPRGAPGVDTLAIIHEFNLPQEFPEEALIDARRQAAEFDESIGNGRVDLTGVTTLTIDPIDARDFDDAISLDKLENGHWLLGVHIADVTHFVEAGSALDQEARERATSVYLPDRVIPMLPEIISNNLASLQPDRVRYTMTAQIEMTADGALVACDVVKGAIRSRRRFTYEEVDDFLADRTAWKKKLDGEVFQLLEAMHHLAMILRRRRMERGSLELSMPEVKVDLDADGRVTGAHVVEHTESHQIIEEFMLAANEAVATALSDAELPFMRRIHEDPNPRKLQALTEFVEELGFKTESLESRFAIQKLLTTVRESPEEYAVNYAVLRSMQKAIYSPLEEGHYALASECYCHFTSPIRRYPDLLVHRLFASRLTGKAKPQPLEQLTSLAEHCSQREQRAASAERELTKVKLLDYMSGRIGEELVGIVTGVESFGLFVQGQEVPAEGFVHITALTDDYYHFDRTTHSLTGHRQGNSFRLGDKVRVAVANVDVERRQLDFRMLGKWTAADRRPQRQATGRTARKKSSKAAKSSKRPPTKKTGAKRHKPKKRR